MAPQGQVAPQAVPQPIPQPAPQTTVPTTPDTRNPQPVVTGTSPNSPQQASPQATSQPATPGTSESAKPSTPENATPTPKTATPISQGNPVANMSPEMIAQVVNATKVRSDHNEGEVVESIKPAYITELEEDLSADMDALGGDKNSMAARMFDELKDDEMTIAASQMGRPVVKQQEEKSEGDGVAPTEPK
jgi:hypothetical protein